jgi:two-component system chemotaxis response regulator CheB
MAPIRAVLVEDSATQARAIIRMLEAERDIRVVETATGADEAVAKVAALKPDVVTMDLDIPGGGQTAIQQIMAESPTPILVLSGRFEEGTAPPAVAALAAGAVEALPKPKRWGEQDAVELRRQVRRVASVPVVGRRQVTRRPRPPRAAAPRKEAPIVAIAASTGGPPALVTLLAALNGVPAPIVVVQHIHPTFAAGFATWLAQASGRQAELAEDGIRATDACVHVAPPDFHTVLRANRRLALVEEPRSLHRPSADVLFESLAAEAGSGGIGVVLTGMGDDGARGLLALRNAGGRTFAQDEETSAVFGMPRAAHAAGAVDELLPIDELGEAVRRAVVARW